LADLITKTRTLENVQGVESVTISLNREMLVSIDLRHSLIREEIRKLKKNQINYAVPIEVPHKG
jgi:copper chaperone CopZ